MVCSEGKSFTTITNPQSGFKEELDIPKAASHVLKEYVLQQWKKDSLPISGALTLHDERPGDVTAGQRGLSYPQEKRDKKRKE